MRIIFEETGEVRLPKRGDYFSLNGSIVLSISQRYTEHPILREVEDRCGWTEYGDGWKTSCGNIIFDMLGAFCPFCGKKVYNET